MMMILIREPYVSYKFPYRTAYDAYREMLPFYIISLYETHIRHTYI